PGYYHHLVQKLRLDCARFRYYYRMDTTQFHMLLSKVGPFIERQNTFWREPMKPGQRPAIYLRTIAYSYRVGISTVVGMVAEVCRVTWEGLEMGYMPEPTTEDWRTVEGIQEYVAIRCPGHSGSLYFNYKEGYSIVLLAVVDARCRFWMVHIGAYWRNTCCFSIWQGSSGWLPSPARWCPSTWRRAPRPHAPCHCDQAFPLLRYMMRPFPGRALTQKWLNFNHSLSRARMTWQAYQRAMAVSPDKADWIVKDTCMLYNLLHQEPRSTHGIGAYAGHSAGNQGSVEALAVRDKLTVYFSSPAGALQ
uniref:DDE Tnp4 domain-containing protein n=1 Tax=Esox lucius TaxID=8010 RepID=A0A6Q2Y3T7_ESOLU